MGTLIARVLASGLNSVGAIVLLCALAATGLLLATNFSFVRAYVRIAAAFGNRFVFFRTLPEKFNAWRAARREQAQARMEMRRAARAEREEARQVAKLLQREKTADERVAEFLSEGVVTERDVSASAAIKR